MQSSVREDQFQTWAHKHEAAAAYFSAESDLHLAPGRCYPGAHPPALDRWWRLFLRAKSRKKHSHLQVQKISIYLHFMGPSPDPFHTSPTSTATATRGSSAKGFPTWSVALKKPSEPSVSKKTDPSVNFFGHQLPKPHIQAGVALTVPMDSDAF